MVNPTNEMRSDKSSMGFRPNLSDALPSIGANKNCIAAKDANRIPRAIDPD